MNSISTLNMTRENWLEERRKGLGGSDGASVFNLNPFNSSYDLYLDKKGQAESVEENERMHFGNILEPIIADEYVRRTGKKVRNLNKILIHPKYPFIRANVDRRIVGEKRVLECKSADKWTLKNWGSEEENIIPEYYYIQVMHYMLFDAFKLGGDLAVLIGGNDFRIYNIEPNKETSQMLINGYCTWWDNFKKNIPPEVVNIKDAANRWSDCLDESIEATPEIKEMSEKIAIQKGNIVESKSIIDHYQLEIVKYMKNFVVLSYNDAKLNTWKPQSRTGIDVKRLRKEQPEIAEEYSKVSTSRVFR